MAPHPRTTAFEPVEESLVSLLGEGYMEGVYAARSALSGDSAEDLRRIGAEEVAFYPEVYRAHLEGLLDKVGQPLVSAAQGTAEGATSDEFRAHSSRSQAPLSCLGYYRAGEDGRLYLTTKSAHYHTPLGHNFPGFRLLEHARHLGIANATHNNTRGHITRLLEERLISQAAGSLDLPAELASSRENGVLNRVLNLETGSLAAEAVVKMILARFHPIYAESAAPKYAGRTPVFGVLADDDGALKANYHGTTVLTQLMRGMWPDLLDALQRSNALAVRAVRPNDMEGLEAFFAEWNTPPFKVAGFFHELVMMNYGARALSREFVARLYALCQEHDAAAVVDEIQTCVWSPELFMFREYGVKPDAVVLGKGFPGGEYAASRVLFSAALDNLPQFGALVTNGQEELASLAYLITMRWAEANASVARDVGEYYETRVREMAEAFPDLVASIEGRRHMLGVYFLDLPRAKEFTRRMQEGGLDISVQTYKEGCPPCALTKLPLICSHGVVDFVVTRMRDALGQVR